MKTMEEWTDIVRPVVSLAHLVAWDGCHKIYVATDEAQARWFRENYEDLYEGSPSEMMTTVTDWWEQSCSLRFVNAVCGDEGQERFVTVIGQDWDDEYDYEDEDEGV